MTNREAPRARPMLVAGLLKLYPRPWRVRYEEEFVELVMASPLSISLIVDLLAGAVDARIHPQSALNSAARPAASKGEPQMLGRLLKLRCVGYAPHITTRDQWVGAGVMIGLTVVFTLIWMRARAAMGDNPYVESFAAMPFLAAYLLSMPLTHLKGRSRSAQTVFIGGSLLIMTLCALASALIRSRP